jgi:predicted RNase H-like HicB family nuclease
MKSLNYTVVLERNEDGGYTVTAPALKGCVTQGQNISEALTRAKEAIECQVEALISLGKRIPADSKRIRLDAEGLSEALLMKVTAQPDFKIAKAGVKFA